MRWSVRLAALKAVFLGNGNRLSAGNILVVGMVIGSPRQQIYILANTVSARHPGGLFHTKEAG
ncbi:hypothetical protein F8A10_07635 [Paracoccus kondratievae]|uniref:hypothetical protein n=1 Tax=Paracoccus kondratievae TaxID=135740 RepID=UPI0012662C18|nr:hypothetical protein [Paracoccus kondratievae]QFQ87304.1 hypothetical protein F8A10_07635 [Paracoccus kondratievae]